MVISMDFLRGLDDNASDFDGLDVLNKIKACINNAAGCSASELGADLGQSLDELQESVSLRLANQTDLLYDYRALSDMPFPVSFDNAYIVCICLAYAIIIITSIVGNVLVCYVIIKMRRMHTVTNLFILNLAVSDLLITCLNIPFSLVRLLMDDWPLGSVLCQLLPFVQITAVYVSSWTMVCIAYDRLRVIVFPLRPRLTFRAGVIMVIVMWILASLMSTPYAAFHQVTQFQFTKPTKLCAAMYPSGLDFRQYLSLGTFILQFFIPLNITGFSYGIIGLNLWSTKAILKANGNHQTNHLSSILRNRQKTIKMLVAVVMVFSGCWLPISLYHLTRDFNPQNDSSNHNVFVFFILHWLAMSSVAYNPAIYCCWNQCYRSQAKRLARHLCQCCVCCWRGRGVDGGTSQAKVRIEGLIVRFSRKPDYPMNGSIEFSQRSFNWDSINGVKEIIHVQEGKRTYTPAQRVAL
ncbi:G-protein coupled receptor 83-like [Paramacrobiotus metropolitanus]|uniref:G-protein coupled receptor 83-like n=1 Tax=Paramacrobiotus metropolitanus TaxID=2943436 RepID=UPI0024456C23|nr:G-protein coupled receptor 83-like [Paramacrobiotus metropolitanus]